MKTARVWFALIILAAGVVSGMGCGQNEPPRPESLEQTGKLLPPESPKEK